MEIPPLKTFICYAHEDHEVVEGLRKHLTLFEKRGLLEIWFDGKILAGEDWDKSIKTKLEQAELVLMFVSVDFINSEYIEKTELQAALQRHRDGLAALIPIIVRACHWAEYFEIGQFQALPNKALPILSSHFPHRDDAFHEVSEGVRRTALAWQEKRIAQIKADAERAETEAQKQKEAAEKAEKQRHNRDEAAWKKVLAEAAAAESAEDKIEIYQTYLEDHQNHRDEAEAAVHALQAELDIARKLKQKREEAEQKRREEQRRAEADRAAFATARTRADFEAYLKKYSLHAEEAREKIAAFKKEEEKARRAEEELKKREEEARLADETRRAKEAVPEMILIKGGTFDMGDTFGEGGSDEKPVHKVTVGDFYLGKYAVTVAQFKAFIEDSGYQTDADKDGGSTIWNGKEWVKTKYANWRRDLNGKVRPVSEHNHPVIHVSWNDAKACAEWYSKKTGLLFRLPTEAEWEYAAREGGKKIRFGNGKDIADPKEMNFYAKKDAKQPYSVVGEYRQKTMPVDAFQPNVLGLHQMSGNVWEWCEDWYYSGYNGAPTDGSAWLSPAGSGRVLRGGSWSNDPQVVRAASRGVGAPGDRYSNIGFRLARTV